MFTYPSRDIFKTHLVIGHVGQALVAITDLLATEDDVVGAGVHQASDIALQASSTRQTEDNVIHTHTGTTCMYTCVCTC